MPRYIEVINATSETTAKILAMRAGGKTRTINVTTDGGKTASVNWSDDRMYVTLNMPTLPVDAILTRGEADRLVAFIAHECCHVLHSDRAAWNKAVLAGARVRDWTNALEDVRIEAAEIKAGHFPALGGLLSGMANHLHYEAVIAARDRGRAIGDTVAQAPYVACILGRVANGYAMPAANGLAAGLSSDVGRLIDVALSDVRRCTSTDDVRRLAERLVAMEQALPQDSRDGSRNGQDGRDGSQGSREGRDDPGTGSITTDTDLTAIIEKIANSSITTDADLTAIIEKIAGRAGIDVDSYAYDNSNGPATARCLATARCQFRPADAWGISPTRNAVAAGRLQGQLPRNAVLHGQIGRLLVSAEVRRVTRHESSGRLDRRALTRMRTGAADVYSRKDDQPGIDTALMILIDGSSSMLGISSSGATRMTIAVTAAWHIACAAETAGAKVCVALFRTRRDKRNDLVPGATITIVKDWNTRVQDRAHVLADLVPSGGTPMSPAIIASSEMLADVGATRHVLMVLTDGDCDYGPDGVTQACVLAGDRGVETVGIGMACASVIRAFPPRYSINVENLTQLAEKGLGVLVQMLEDANPRGAD